MRHRTASTKGFRRTGKLLEGQIRRTSEARGFAQAKVLTHWPEIAGADVAAIARPVDIKFGRGGLGATLTLLTTGAQAPMLEMRKEQLREKVNAIYGYSAISRIRITQTAATGFEEGQVSFEHRPTKETAERPADPAAIETASPVRDDGLRAALERLGTNILNKSPSRE